MLTGTSPRLRFFGCLIALLKKIATEGSSSKQRAFSPADQTKSDQILRVRPLARDDEPFVRFRTWGAMKPGSGRASLNRQ